MPKSKFNLRVMNYKLPELHGKPTLTFKDLVGLIIIGIFVFLPSGVHDVFEVSLEWSRKYETVEVAELAILSLILAFAFGIFSFLKWREIKHEMANYRQAEQGIENLNRRLNDKK